MPGPRFRLADPGDADEIALVHARSWEAAYLGMLPHEVLTGLVAAQGADFWRRVLTSAQRADAVAVAEFGDAVVGFVSFGPLRERIPGYRGEFYALYVLPEAQGCGIGTGLVARAARTLVRWRAIGAVVWVLEENRAARRFYERLDGIPLGTPKPLRYRGQAYEAVREVGYGWPDLRRARWLVDN